MAIEPDPKVCPDCSGPMVTDNTRSLGRLRYRYRTCQWCERHDRALIQPATVLSAVLVQECTPANPDAGHDALN